MTKRERECLQRLIEKQEEEERQDKEFFQQVNKRWKEIINFYAGDKKCRERISQYLKDQKRLRPEIESIVLGDIAAEYGCETKELIEFISTPDRIDFYKRQKNKKQKQILIIVLILS